MPDLPDKLKKLKMDWMDGQTFFFFLVLAVIGAIYWANQTAVNTTVDSNKRDFQKFLQEKWEPFLIIDQQRMIELENDIRTRQNNIRDRQEEAIQELHEHQMEIWEMTIRNDERLKIYKELGVLNK
jgi:hypothetical protein